MKKIIVNLEILLAVSALAAGHVAGMGPPRMGGVALVGPDQLRGSVVLGRRSLSSVVIDDERPMYLFRVRPGDDGMLLQLDSVGEVAWWGEVFDAFSNDPAACPNWSEKVVCWEFAVLAADRGSGTEAARAFPDGWTSADVADSLARLGAARPAWAAGLPDFAAPKRQVSVAPGALCGRLPAARIRVRSSDWFMQYGLDGCIRARPAAATDSFQWSEVDPAKLALFDEVRAAIETDQLATSAGGLVPGASWVAPAGAGPVRRPAKAHLMPAGSPAHYVRRRIWHFPTFVYQEYDVYGFTVSGVPYAAQIAEDGGLKCIQQSHGVPPNCSVRGGACSLILGELAAMIGLYGYELVVTKREAWKSVQPPQPAGHGGGSTPLPGPLPQAVDPFAAGPLPGHAPRIMSPFAASPLPGPSLRGQLGLGAAVAEPLWEISQNPANIHQSLDVYEFEAGGVTYVAQFGADGRVKCMAAAVAPAANCRVPNGMCSQILGVLAVDIATLGYQRAVAARRLLGSRNAAGPSNRGPVVRRQTSPRRQPRGDVDVAPPRERGNQPPPVGHASSRPGRGTSHARPVHDPKLNKFFRKVN